MNFKSFLAVAALAVALPTSAMAQTPALEWTVIPDSISSTIGGIQMHGSAVVEVDGKKFLYIVGGNRQVISAGDTNLIWYSELLSLDPPTVGPWTEATYQLATSTGAYIARSTFGHDGRLYIVGGSNNHATDPAFNGVRVFEPTATGDITAEATALGVDGAALGITPSIGNAETGAVLDPTTNYLYAISGSSNVVHRFTINPTSGAAEDYTLLTSNLLWNYSHSNNPVIHDGYLYVFGTSSAGNQTKVQFAEILSDGTLGSFQAAADMPTNRYDAGAAVVKGDIFVMAGAQTSNNDVQNTVLKATLGDNGNITGWTVDSEIPGTLPPDVEGAVPGLRRVGAVSLGDDGVAILGGRSYGANFLGNLYFAVPTASNVSDWELY